MVQLLGGLSTNRSRRAGDAIEWHGDHSTGVAWQVVAMCFSVEIEELVCAPRAKARRPHDLACASGPHASATNPTDSHCTACACICPSTSRDLAAIGTRANTNASASTRGSAASGGHGAPTHNGKPGGREPADSSATRGHTPRGSQRFNPDSTTAALRRQSQKETRSGDVRERHPRA